MRNKLLIIMIMMFLLTFMGCQQNDSKIKIYDDDALILETADTYTYSVRTESHANVANQFGLNFRGFTGKETIFTLTVNQTKTIDIDYFSEISSGQFKVVVTTPEDKVYTILTGSDDNDKSVTLVQGSYKIKLVGKTAFGSVSLTLSNIDNVAIIKSTWA